MAIKRTQRAYRCPDCAGGLCCSSRAEDEHLFALERYPRAADHLTHTVKVGVVADESAVDLLDRVDRTHQPCGVGYFVEVGNDLFLVGDRDVYALKLARCEKGRDLVGRKLTDLVVVIRKSLVYFFGKAVRELFADQSVFHFLVFSLRASEP